MTKKAQREIASALAPGPATEATAGDPFRPTPEPEPKAEFMKITNLQKFGCFHLQGKVNKDDAMYKRFSIYPGKTEEVPMVVWNRYKDREDVLAMDGIKIKIGGLKQGERFEHPDAERTALELLRRELESKTRELNDYRDTLRVQGEHLEAEQKRIDLASRSNGGRD